MSQFDKLIRRIKKLDKSLRFDELKRVLEHYGYEVSNPTSGSSHYTFRKAGKPKITIPKHASIKVVYVRAVKVIVEGEENDNEES